jgi:hypothetical protein
MPRRVPVLGGIAAAVCLLFATPAGAATLLGDYQFQGTRASSGPGPQLLNVGDVGGTYGFVNDTVMGVPRKVLTFSSGSGLQMAPAGLTSNSYSEVVTFRFTTALAPPEDYARILDSTDGSLDTGLYDNLGFLDFYEGGNDYQQGTSPVFADNTYATVALVVDSGGTRGYFNGVLKSAFPGLYAVQSDTLRFFKDDNTENSAGGVSCIRVYSGGLTDAEIAGIGASPTCGDPTAVTPSTPTPATTTPLTPHKKKCKKKHKKRSAESAKKKKCKKHKKKR